MTSEANPLPQRYRLLSELGRGGMGSVWRARDEWLDREVAIKKLAFALDPDDRTERRERALREAKTLARVDHPAVVDIYDVQIPHDGHPWIVMKYIRGTSLAEIIQKRSLPEPEIARIGVPILDALRAVHAAHVVHRDVKPANIVVADDDLVYLVNFGIAKVSGDRTLTSHSKLLGTLEFLAPELFSGDKGSPAADLWSLGVTLFYALEGYSPFLVEGGHQDAATIAAITVKEPPRPRRDGPLADVILKLLRKDPAQRPPAAQVARVLESVLDRPPAPGPWRPPPTEDAFARPGPGGHPAALTWRPGAARPRRLARTQAEPSTLLRMPHREAAALLASYPPEEAGALLNEMAAAQPRTAAAFLQVLSSSQAAHAVDHLNPDMAAALLASMRPGDAARILNRASVRTAAAVIMALPTTDSAVLVKAMRSDRLARVLEYVKPVTVADLLQSAGEFDTTLLGLLSAPLREQVVRQLHRSRRVRHEPG